MRRVLGCVAFAAALWSIPGLAQADELRIYNPNPKTMSVYVRARANRGGGARSWIKLEIPAEGEDAVGLRSDDPFDVCFWFPGHVFGGLYDVPLREFIGNGAQAVPLEWPTEFRRRSIWVFDPASGEFLRRQQKVQGLGPTLVLEVGDGFIRVELPGLIGYDPPRPPVIPPRPRRGG